MTARVRLDDRALRAKLEAALLVAAKSAGARLVGHLQRRLNVSASVARAKSIARSRARRRRLAKFVYQASLPGQPPRKRTGTLQKSVTSQVTRGDGVVTIRVGTKIPYGKFLEMGTRAMRPRPWLRSGVAEIAPRLQRDFVASLKRALAKG